MAFARLSLRRTLKKCTHLGIAQEMLSQIWKHSIYAGEPVVVLDAPLLFESKASLLCKVGSAELEPGETVGCIPAGEEEEESNLIILKR